MNKCIRSLAILPAFFAGITHAAEIRHISVENRGGVYFVEFDALVAAEQSDIYALLTDYNHLHRLNNTIQHSRLINEKDDPVKKCRLLLHSCILFFCRDVVLVESVQENGMDEVIASVDPEVSDFSSGRSVWKIFRIGNRMTGIELRRHLEPSFWVPPMIGPWVIKNRMKQELSEMLVRLEQYAGA